MNCWRPQTWVDVCEGYDDETESWTYVLVETTTTVPRDTRTCCLLLLLLLIQLPQQLRPPLPPIKSWIVKLQKLILVLFFGTKIHSTKREIMLYAMPLNLPAFTYCSYCYNVCVDWFFDKDDSRHHSSCFGRQTAQTCKLWSVTQETAYKGGSRTLTNCVRVSWQLWIKGISALMRQSGSAVALDLRSIGRGFTSHRDKAA